MQQFFEVVKKILKAKLTRHLCRIIVGGIFLYTGVAHLKYPFGFEEEVLKYNLLPHFIIPLFAQIMPWLEVLAGSLFLLNLLPVVSGSILASLLLTYIGAIGINLLRGVSFDECGCVAGFIFPTEVEEIERAFQNMLGKTSLEAVVRDVVLLAMVSIVLIHFPEVRRVLRKIKHTLFAHR